ncbi:hypothetical protein LTR95_008460 [Oleoguttula sp. CCFEE 5521]
MALDSAFLAEHTILRAVGLSIALFATAFYYTFARASLPANLPQYTTETWPIIGCMQFFTERWSNFTFHAGHKVVVALSGEESRKIFFDNR